MKALKVSFLSLIFCALLAGCSFFDDAKEIAEQLKYYKKYALTLEDKVKNLLEIIDTLKSENIRLKNELQKYQDAHRKMLQ